MDQNNVNNRVDLQLIFEKLKIESMVELFIKIQLFIREDIYWRVFSQDFQSIHNLITQKWSHEKEMLLQNDVTL